MSVPTTDWLYNVITIELPSQLLSKWLGYPYRIVLVIMLASNSHRIPIILPSVYRDVTMILPKLYHDFNMILPWFTQIIYSYTIFTMIFPSIYHMISAVPRKATWAPGPTETGETEAAPPGSPTHFHRVSIRFPGERFVAGETNQNRTGYNRFIIYIIIYIYSLVI